jgi:AcrR family transcriptional regulator
MTPARSRRPLRADAERSIARILDAALDALARDPEASMSEIARRAGVVRATIYVHFPTREALIAAVTERAVADVIGVVEAAEPDTGDATAALRRVTAAAWGALGRYHALVAINVRRHHTELRAQHDPLLTRLEPLVERGQREGAFRADVPAAWHLSMLMALMHAASGELQAGRLRPEQVETALVETVLGAVRAAPD